MRKLKPNTPGTRMMSFTSFDDLTKIKPEKSLRLNFGRSGGRDGLGHLTARHRGGGSKRFYRMIDFKRNKFDIPGKVMTLEYDPNRSARIALVQYKDGEKRYILQPIGLRPGNIIMSGENAEIKLGNALPLKKIPVGNFIHNIELKKGMGGQLARSAGTYVQIVGRDTGVVQIKLGSGELRVIPQECMATVGAVSNADHANIVTGKAGRNRWKGIRPTVRGCAMNPVDHPHGGGEGKSSAARHPVTPWGKGTKGKKTRNNKRTDRWIVRRANKRKDRQAA